MLIIDHASKFLHQKAVLQDVCLSMEAGHVYGLHGINGSGKTMLLRLMSGLMYADEGTVSWNGKALGRDLDFPLSMGLLIETPAFIDEFSGLRNLKLVAELKNTATLSDLQEAMKRFALDPEDNKKVSRYSLGMRQKLGLAMAFMEKPELILLDEPTNALDEEGKDVLASEIRKSSRVGSLVVVASHERDFLNEVADRTYLVREGRVAADEK